MTDCPHRSLGLARAFSTLSLPFGDTEGETEDVVEHARGEAAGLCILPAGVIGAYEGGEAIAQRIVRGVFELDLGKHASLAAQHAQIAVQADATESDHDSRAADQR